MISHLVNKKILLVVLLSFLTACGGGGGGGSDPAPENATDDQASQQQGTDSPVSNGGSNAPSTEDPTNTTTSSTTDTVSPLTGAAVKGPLINAIAKAYLLDPSRADFKGLSVATGKTDDKANIIGIELPDDGEIFLVEISSTSDTVDLNTGVAPVLTTLQTIVTKDQLANGIYITPATTLAVHIAQATSESGDNTNDVIANLSAASNLIATYLGFGLPATDIFTTNPLVVAGMNDLQLSQALAYRTGLELIVAIANQLIIDNGSALEWTSILSILASDLVELEQASGNLETLTGNYFTQINLFDVANLALPNTQNGAQPYTVDEVEKLMKQEATTIAPTFITSRLDDESVQVSPVAKVTEDPETPSEPETTDPETTDPETTDPETTDPETTDPETTDPETTDPETTDPETTDPETTDPETTDPETTDPETTDPETTDPDADSDGISDASDICPNTSNPEQKTTLDWSGNGTTADTPYLICNAAMLTELSDRVNDLDTDYNEAFYELTEDIDLASIDWNPIGNTWDELCLPSEAAFFGHFDGKGHTIKNLTLNDSRHGCYGLFGVLDGAEISNLVLDNISVNYSATDTTFVSVGSLAAYTLSNTTIDTVSVTGIASAVTGYHNVGGIVGSGIKTTINNASSSADVTTDTTTGNNGGGIMGYAFQSSIIDTSASGNISGWAMVGGLIGQAVDAHETLTSVKRSSASGNIEATASAGGLIGSATNNITIETSAAIGSVTGLIKLGGLVGEIVDSSVANSFSSGGVSGNSSTGGLIGRAQASQIENSYTISTLTTNADKGGLIGSALENVSVTSSYWNSDNFAQDDHADSIGLTTEQLKDISQFSGWDFTSDEFEDEQEDYWVINSTDNCGFPSLRLVNIIVSGCQ